MLYLNDNRIGKSVMTPNNMTTKFGIITGIYELTGSFDIYEGDQPTIYVNRTSTTAEITNRTSVARQYIRIYIDSDKYPRIATGAISPNGIMHAQVSSDDTDTIIVII